MRVKCEQVWLEISNYLEGDVDANLRDALGMHLQECKRCQAVRDGTRNVMLLYGDDRMIETPLGFSYRLQRRLEENTQPNRRSVLGWMAVAAASLVVAGSLGVARLSVFNSPHVRSQHAQPGSGIPPELVVITTTTGRVFHGSSACPFIHDKTHLRPIVALEAIKDGYSPCVRCLTRYCEQASTSGSN